MKTLKEMVGEQRLTKEQDIDIIKRWFVENDCEQDGLVLIPFLAKSQTEKIKRKYDFALTWNPNLQDLRKVVKDKEVAEKLNRLQVYCTLDYPMQEDNQLLIWARENIHNKMEVPKVFFMPTVLYLQKYGVEFVLTEQERRYLQVCAR